jgi:uncharacterized protein YjdB
MPCTDQPIGRGWVLGLLIAVGACAGGETVGTDAQHDGSSVTVRISPPVDSLGVGETRRLTIAVTDEDGTRRSAIVKWKSANPAIATVGKAGDVIALAEGAVAIVATVGSRSDTASIYVRPGNLSIQPNAVNSVVGEAVRFSATAGAARDTSSLRVTWASSNTNVAVVDPDGTVSMVGQGEAILTATAGARTGTASVSVHQRDIASLRVTPATSTMYPNDSAQLHIAAFDDAGRAMALVPGNVQWSSSDSHVVTVTDGGVVTARAAGSAAVTVHIGNKTATAAINVQGLPVSSVFVSLETGTLEVGQVTKAKATLADADGTTLTGRAIAWQSSNPAIATVNSLGLVTAVGRGTATISAIAEGKVGGADLTVATKNVASVAISPNPASAAVGQKARLTATVKDASGGALTGRTVTWTSGNPAVATVSANGLVTAVSVGTATISASTGGVTGTAQFQSTTVAAASVSVSPSAPNVRVGEDVQLTATATDAGGNVLASRVPTWSSSNPIVATVSSSGRVTGVSKGTATVTATVDGKSAPASVSVANAAPAPVASITVTLSASSINAGQSTQAVAVTRDAAGNVVTGRTIAWSSAAPALATVSASGVVSALAAGSVSISATSEGVSNSATLIITGSTQPVATVSLSAPSTSMIAGQTQALSVTLKDASGNTLTGRTIAWSSSSTSVATVSPSGQVTAIGAGSAVITATSEGKSGTLTLKVAAAPVDPPASVAVTAPATTLAIAQTTQATAVPKDSKGTPLTGRTVTWSSSSPNIATVSATGLITAVAAGTVAIKATVDGVVGTLGITVSGSTSTSGTVTTVRVTLAQAVVQVGGSTQATALALDARSNAVSAGPPTWSSSNTTVASVSSSGVVTAVATGQATIKATINGVSGSGTVSVTSTSYASGNAIANVPTLPQALPSTTVGAPTRVVRLAAGADLQSALNAAQPGDEIRLAAGATWTGNFVIPATSACSVSQWITVRSDVSDTQLPASGARMPPTAATGLAKIVTNNATAALRTNGPTCGWRFLGLEIVSTNDPTVLNYGIVKLGDGGSVGAGEVQTSLSKVPQDFILDRLFVHGTATANVVRCIVLNSGRTAVLNSWISDCHSKGWDSQAIEGWNGPGPYLIENNFLSGAGENVMFGGADPGVYGLSPSDITIRGNHVWKDPTWKGKWTAKNLFELKNARRVLIENNVFENNWADAQQGMAIVIKSSQDSCGTCTWQGTTDVTFRYNIVRNSPRGFNVQAVDCTGQACVDVHVQRVRAENNVFENIGTFNGTGTDGFLTLLTHDLTDVALIHNTFVGNLPTTGIGTVMDYGAGAARRLQIDDNIFAGHSDYAVFYSGMQVGIASLQAMAGSSWSYQRNVTGNVNPAYVSKFPIESWYPTLAGIGFTSATDYRLSSSSPFKGRGSGGTDPGANIDELSRRTAGSKVGM